jgi:hypothetical protein
MDQEKENAQIAISRSRNWMDIHGGAMARHADLQQGAGVFLDDDSETVSTADALGKEFPWLVDAIENSYR